MRKQHQVLNKLGVYSFQILDQLISRLKRHTGILENEYYKIRN